MTEHTITVQRCGIHPTMGDWEASYEITFRAERGDAFGWPDLHFVSISPDAGDHGAFSDLAQKDLESWAADWLQTDGYDQAVRIATEDREPDPDAARDQRIDDGLMERGR